MLVMMTVVVVVVACHFYYQTWLSMIKCTNYILIHSIVRYHRSWDCCRSSSTITWWWWLLCEFFFFIIAIPDWSIDISINLFNSFRMNCRSRHHHHHHWWHFDWLIDVFFLQLLLSPNLYMNRLNSNIFNVEMYGSFIHLAGNGSLILFLYDVMIEIQK